MTILDDAGKDKSRHKLVLISCSHCGTGTDFRPDEAQIMRLSDLTRKIRKRKNGKRRAPAMSCGCLEREAYEKFRKSRQRSGPLRVMRKWVRNPIWEKFSDAGFGSPLLICALVARSGEFKPSISVQLEPIAALTEVNPVNLDIGVAA